MSIAIVGAGRIGTALYAASQRAGIACDLWQRADSPSALGAQLGDLPAHTPIVVCTRNDALPAVLLAVPHEHHADLVLVQNGMLRDFVRENGLQHATRGLLFFAVASRGADAEPGGVSPFVGRHAQQLAGWLTQLGLPAEAVEPPAFAAIEVEKLLWNCIFGLLSQALQLPVGPIARDHAGDVAALVHELLPVALRAAPEAASVLGSVAGEHALTERLRGYSLAIADYRGAVKEWPWRNGWFVAAAGPDGLPVQHQWLVRAGLAAA